MSDSSSVWLVHPGVPALSVADGLSADFEAACMDRYRALIQLERRDSPENRDACKAADEAVDAVLDMWLDSRGDCE
jgi:hypothetical protein